MSVSRVEGAGGCTRRRSRAHLAAEAAWPGRTSAENAVILDGFDPSPDTRLHPVSKIGMRRTRCVAVWLLLSGLSQPATAQVSYLWSFEERVSEADLVVIAAKVGTWDTGHRTTITELTPPFPVIEVQTEFKILAVVKGSAGSDTLRLRHYRWDADRLAPGGVINGPRPLNLTLTGVDPRAGFLLFLKRDIDGVFVPISGQASPEDSVFVLRPVG